MTINIEYTTKAAIEAAHQELLKTYPALRVLIVRAILHATGKFRVVVRAYDPEAAGTGGRDTDMGWDASRIFLEAIFSATPDAQFSGHLGLFHLAHWTKPQFEAMYPCTAFLPHWKGGDVWMHDIRDIKHIVQRPVDPNTAWNITSTDSDGETWMTTVRDQDLEVFFGNELDAKWETESLADVISELATKAAAEVRNKTDRWTGTETAIEITCGHDTYYVQKMRVFHVD